MAPVHGGGGTHGSSTMVNCHWDCGLWTVDCGGWTVEAGLWRLVNAPLSASSSLSESKSDKTKTASYGLPKKE
jgi:hypothetical protein